MMSLSLLDRLVKGTCCKCTKDLTTFHKIWQCEKKHMTCYQCFGDRMHDDEKQICFSCSESLKSIKHLCEENEHVFIYVDDSNMWIEAKKLAANKFNLKCKEDPRLRLDIGKVADVVANNRKVAWGTLYGSEPPERDSVWQKIRERGWKVITTKRSTFTGKEKQVDHQMVADITALVSGCIAKGKIVIVSGDADMIPAISKSLHMNWSIEIWMWENGVSNSLKQLAEKNPGLMSINFLDSRLEEVTFTNFTFGPTKIPKTRSVIIKDIDFTPDGTWQNKLAEELGWPFQICMIGPKKVQNPMNFKDVILIFSNARAKGKKDFEKDYFDEICADLKRKYPGKISHYPAYQNQFDQPEEICLANRFEELQSLDAQLNEESLSSDDVPSSYGAIGGLDEDDEKEEFQVVRSKQKKKTQKYSTPCKLRSNCSWRFKCQYHHTDDEKKFFRNFRKDRECWHKGKCKFGPSKCSFAHANEDSFCRKCNIWGHLEKNCLTPQNA